MLHHLFILISIFLICQVVGYEECFKNYSYDWDEQLSTDEKRCNDGYWELEIFDADGLKDVKKFLKNAKNAEGYFFYLNMNCTRKCSWNHAKTEVTFNKFQSKPNHSIGTAYFRAGMENKWIFGNISNHPLGIICMKQRSEGTRKEPKDGLMSGGMIIWVALGSASVALLMLLIALSVILLKRRKSSRGLTERTTSSGFCSSKRTQDAPHQPSTNQKSTPFSHYSPANSSEKFLFSSPTYANHPALQPNNENGSLFYAQLSWNETPNNIADQAEQDHVDVSNVYENNADQKVVGPMGDIYSIAQSRVSQMK